MFQVESPIRWRPPSIGDGGLRPSCCPSPTTEPSTGPADPWSLSPLPRCRAHRAPDASEAAGAQKMICRRPSPSPTAADWDGRPNATRHASPASMPPDRRTAHPSTTPTCLFDAGRWLHSGRLPSAPGNIPLAHARREMGRGPWAHGAGRSRSTALPYRDTYTAELPVLGWAKRKVERPNRLDRQTGKTGKRGSSKSSAQGSALTKARRRLSRSTNLLPLVLLLLLFFTSRSFLLFHSLLYLRSRSLFFPHDLFINALLLPPPPTYPHDPPGTGAGCILFLHHLFWI